MLSDVPSICFVNNIFQWIRKCPYWDYFATLEHLLRHERKSVYTVNLNWNTKFHFIVNTQIWNEIRSLNLWQNCRMGARVSDNKSKHRQKWILKCMPCWAFSLGCSCEQSFEINYYLGKKLVRIQIFFPQISSAWASTKKTFALMKNIMAESYFKNIFFSFYFRNFWRLNGSCLTQAAVFATMPKQQDIRGYFQTL